MTQMHSIASHLPIKVKGRKKDEYSDNNIIIIYKAFIAPMLEFRALYSYMNKKIN